jgi:hypothetical protein
MTNHEQNPADNTPDFMVRFDGTQPEIDETEQAVVARGFSELVDELVRKHPYASSGQGVGFDLLNSEQRWVVHVLPADEQGVRAPEHSYPDKALSLEFVDMFGDAQEEYLYELRDDVVRRKDLGAPGGDDFLNEADYQAALNVGIEAADTAQKGEELERSMGLYDQPIGAAELTGLQVLVLSGQLKPR